MYLLLNFLVALTLLVPQTPTLPATRRPTQSIPQPRVTQPVPKTSSQTRVVRRNDTTGRYTFELTLTASPRVTPPMLDYLARAVQVDHVAANKRDDLKFWTDAPKPLDPARPEIAVRLRPVGPIENPSQFIWRWPDGFEIARPGVITVLATYRPPVIAKAATRAGDIGRAAQALHGGLHHVAGQLRCQSAGGAAPAFPNAGFLPVALGTASTVTDINGQFQLDGEFDGVPAAIRVRYDGRVPLTVDRSTRLQIMDELQDTRDHDVVLPAGTISGDTLQLGAITLAQGDCEIWQLGVATLQDYHARRNQSPPAGELRIKRWSAIEIGAPHTFYDYIVLRTDFASNGTPAGRRATLAHEFGHSIRHVSDGDVHHWNWDNFRWAYARNHQGNEIFNTQYAFNEGWAQYWESRIPEGTIVAPAGLGPLHLDWNENLIGLRLATLSNAAGVGDAVMLQVLEQNPGRIHGLWEFEQRYCATVTLPNAHCTAARAPARQRPNACPPAFTDDGATCRLTNILSKESYGRGVGVPPTQCGAGREFDAGLCYSRCRAGFNGVGPVCWRGCPSTYQDDGATCRRDARIISANTSTCPWWDACGLVGARGCSTCPAGFNNDGCTCRRDVDIFAKESYGRGVGTVPNACGAGMQLDAGLCYQPCRTGFNGAGPVCWDTCPAGYGDHGATCYRDPYVITKF